MLLQSVNNRGEVAEGLFAGQLLQRIVAPETEQHHARLQPRNRFNAVQSSPGSIAVLAEIFNLRPEPATKQRRIIMPWFSPVTRRQTVPEGDPGARRRRGKVRVRWPRRPKPPGQQDRHSCQNEALNFRRHPKRITGLELTPGKAATGTPVGEEACLNHTPGFRPHRPCFLPR